MGLVFSCTLTAVALATVAQASLPSWLLEEIKKKKAEVGASGGGQGDGEGEEEGEREQQVREESEEEEEEVRTISALLCNAFRTADVSIAYRLHCIALYCSTVHVVLYPVLL